MTWADLWKRHLSELGECNVSKDPVEDREDQDGDGQHEVLRVHRPAGDVNLENVQFKKPILTKVINFF